MFNLLDSELWLDFSFNYSQGYYESKVVGFLTTSSFSNLVRQSKWDWLVVLMEAIRFLVKLSNFCLQLIQVLFYLKFGQIAVLGLGKSFILFGFKFITDHFIRNYHLYLQWKKFYAPRFVLLVCFLGLVSQRDHGLLHVESTKSLLVKMLD